MIVAAGDGLLCFNQIYQIKQPGHFYIKGRSKVVHVLKQAPRYKEVLGSGCIAESILNIGTRWR